MELKKKNSTVVIVPKGTQYLGEFYQDGLPDNVVLNKGITGCGATTSAIIEDRKYVIAMPYKALIINKKEDCVKYAKEYLTVYAGGHNVEDITHFSGNKILVTYDSLPKVVEALGESITEWKIMVDECHKIIDDAAFRPKAMRSILDSYRHFGSFIFTTATPIPEEFQLQELLGIRHIQLKWENVTPVKVSYTPMKQKDLLKNVAYQLKKHQTDDIDGNAHVFINSVKHIKEITEMLIELIGVDKSDISVTCARNSVNEKTIGLVGLDIVPAGKNVAKYNFYTSTAFEGCDVFDATGRTYIVTDGKRDHTKVAIETSLPQIIGRVRNSCYKNEVYFMYSTSIYNDSGDYEEFKRQINLQLAKTRKNVSCYEKIVNDPEITESFSKIISSALCEDVLIHYCEKNGFSVNEMAVKNELYKYKVYHQTYYISTDAAGINNGDVVNVQAQPIEFKEVEYSGAEELEIEKVKRTKRPPFAELLKEYVRVLEQTSSLYGVRPVEDYEKIYPDFKDAYKYLGSDKIRKLKYRKKDVLTSTRLAKNMGARSKMIVAKLNYKQNAKYTTSRIIEDLQKVLREVGLECDKIKATLLNEWYDINRCTVPIKGGKQGNGYKILRCKIAIN